MERVMVSSDFSGFRHMVGVVIGPSKAGQRMVRLAAIPQYVMVFDVRELLWL